MLELLCTASALQPPTTPNMLALRVRASRSCAPLTAGFIFAGMAVVGFLLIMPASVISDRLGRKWTIVPSCIAIASACVLMAATGEPLPTTNIRRVAASCVRLEARRASCRLQGTAAAQSRVSRASLGR